MKEPLRELKKVFGERVLENEPLLKHTSFRIGGSARYFFGAKTIDELIQAVQLAVKLNLPYFVLGNGSNILIGDRGFEGLCIKNNCQSLSFIEEKAQVITDAGVPLARLIAEAASHDIGGLEFLSGIPGSVGGAIVSNAGTFGGAIGDFVISASILFPDKTINGSTWLTIDPERSRRVKRVMKNWFKFGYRKSCLSHQMPHPIILTVVFQLMSNRKEEILRKMQHYLTIRAKKQPKEWSAGSYFKNPKVDKKWAKEYLEMIGESSPEMVEAIEKTGHIPAGWLLDQSGAKKLKVRGARVSKVHANFIINPKGKAKAKDVRELAALLKEKVREKFGIMLSEEVEYVGEF